MQDVRIKYFCQFENKIVGDHLSDVCMAFKVDVNEFGKHCAGEDIIRQLGSRSKNKGQADMKNPFHDVEERLKRHPWKKLNFCLKGELRMQ